MSFGSNQNFKFVLLIPVVPFALGAVCTVNSSVDQASFFLARNPDMRYAGMVNIVDVGGSSATMARFWALQATILQRTSMLTGRSVLSMQE